MSPFFAEFDLCGSPPCVIRKDTRVYLHPQTYSPTLRQTKNCVGIVWMCNPGSAAHPAGPVPWEAIQPDPTLRVVQDLYKKIVAAKGPEHVPGEQDYLKILNCYYAVNSHFDLAHAAWGLSGCRYREKIPRSARFVVAAWGRDKPQGPVYQAVRKIKTRLKKSGPKPVLVYVDVAPGGVSQISRGLRSMNYPAHPLSFQFKSNLAALAAHLAKVI